MDIRKVDLNLLVVLDTLLRLQSASRAAAVLNLSQPAISSALRKLRLLFGDPLFVRSAHGLHPTPRALRLVQPLHEVLDRIRTDILEPRTAFVAKTASRRFTLALTDVGELVLLPRLLTRIRSTAPAVSVHSVSLAPAALEDALRTGAVDVAIGYFPAAGSSLIHEQRLFSHSFVCVMRFGHPLARVRMTVRQFLDAEHVLVEPQGKSHEVFERSLSERGLSRRVVATVSHHLALPMILGDSDLIATVPFAVGRALRRTARIKMAEPPIGAPEAEVKQIWHARFENDPANRWLRTIVVDLFGNREKRRRGNSRR
jgi:DNA-binding transcriptional LysR family regulator